VDGAATVVVVAGAEAVDAGLADIGPELPAFASHAANKISAASNPTV
jgi:hypothetical protein